MNQEQFHQLVLAALQQPGPTLQTISHQLSYLNFRLPSFGTKILAKRIHALQLKSTGTDVNASLRALSFVLTQLMMVNTTLEQNIYGKLFQPLLQDENPLMKIYNCPLFQDLTQNERIKLVCSTLMELKTHWKKPLLQNQNLNILMEVIGICLRCYIASQSKNNYNFQQKIPYSEVYPEVLSSFEIKWIQKQKIYQFPDAAIFILTSDEKEFAYGNYQQQPTQENKQFLYKIPSESNNDISTPCFKVKILEADPQGISPINEDPLSQNAPENSIFSGFQAKTISDLNLPQCQSFSENSQSLIEDYNWKQLLNSSKDRSNFSDELKPKSLLLPSKKRQKANPQILKTNKRKRSGSMGNVELLSMLNVKLRQTLPYKAKFLQRKHKQLEFVSKAYEITIKAEKKQSQGKRQVKLFQPQFMLKWVRTDEDDSLLSEFMREKLTLPKLYFNHPY